MCEASVASCEGLCGAPFDTNLICQCSTDCSDFGSCCSDYSAQCLPSDSQAACDAATTIGAGSHSGITLGGNNGFSASCFGATAPDNVFRYMVTKENARLQAVE
ncbi:MAG: hypothetical protein GY822_31905 [Deltaproteobacteria bacterium]|nr:hypothetical protein [Deltaproteobacteria bacterium]